MNNVISLNSRRRHQFLNAGFYLHNRKTSSEEKFFLIGTVLSAAPLVTAGLMYYGTAFLTMLAVGLVLGVFIGLVRFRYFPGNVETYSVKDPAPKIENEKRKAA